MSDEQYVTKAEASRITGFHATWLAYRFDTGHIKGYRDAKGNRMFSVDSLLEYVKVYGKGGKRASKKNQTPARRALSKVLEANRPNLGKVAVP
jgi:hypothetical protein